jgi:hypothetical protein
MNRQNKKVVLMALVIGITSFQSIHSVHQGHLRSEARQTCRIALARSVREDKMVKNFPACTSETSSHVTLSRNSQLIAYTLLFAVFTPCVMAHECKSTQDFDQKERRSGGLSSEETLQRNMKAVEERRQREAAQHRAK